jgi:hypothetical protein
VIRLLPQERECPVDSLVECVRLDVLVCLDPVSLVQEIAAVNAHRRPPSETLGCASLGPDSSRRKKIGPSSPVDFGDNYGAAMA